MVKTTPQPAFLLPIGLPSLRIAWITLPPLPLTNGEYEQILNVLETCRQSLTKDSDGVVQQE